MVSSIITIGLNEMSHIMKWHTLNVLHNFMGTELESHKYMYCMTAVAFHDRLHDTQQCLTLSATVPGSVQNLTTFHFVTCTSVYLQ
jgi:hypothetical protein